MPSRMADHSFDAILMDVNMPVMDGLEATGRHTPIIALTALAIRGDAGWTLTLPSPSALRHRLIN